MAELDQLVGQVLERWRVQGEAPAWEDVLARAGLAEPTHRRAGSRRLYVALLVAGVVALAAPAFAIVARQLLSTRSVPGTTTTTHVELGSGRSADLRLRSSGSPLGRDSAGFRFLRPGADQARSFHWTLELHGLEPGGRSPDHPPGTRDSALRAVQDRWRRVPPPGRRSAGALERPGDAHGGQGATPCGAVGRRPTRAPVTAVVTTRAARESARP